MPSLSASKNGPCISTDMSLKDNWNMTSFLEAKSTALSRLHQEGCLPNIKLNVGGASFTAHMEVLCGASEFFERVISHDSNRSDVVTIDCIEPGIFSLLLSFIYTGELELNVENVFKVYIAADFLILARVVALCRCMLIENLPFTHISEELAGIVSEIVHCFNDSELIQAIFHRQDLLNNKLLLPHLGADMFYQYLHSNVSLMLTSENMILMGNFFVEKLRQIFVEMFPQDSRLPTFDDCVDQIFIKPSCCIQSYQMYGTMDLQDQSVDWVNRNRISTWTNFPPEEWTISGMVFYLIPRWGDTEGLIGGVDVNYRHIRTGERRSFLCGIMSEHPAPYEVQHLQLEDGETIRLAEVHSGWLLDRMQFETSRRRVLGPFGRSSGGGKRIIINASPDWDLSHTVSEDATSICHLALHGFTYSLVRTLGCLSWFNIQFAFSMIRGKYPDILGLKI